MKNVYFISDAHLGSWALPQRRMQERRLVRFLDEIKDHADAVYMLGDMFDFWYEFKYVVPKGYTRFLGKISELTDRGVEVHYFVGNHDVWCYGYLERECGVTLHREPMTTEIMGQVFYLAHGDGMGDPSRSFRLLRSIFRNRTCQFLYSLLPTRLSMWLGLKWARHSMKKHRLNGVEPYYGDDNEYMVVYSREYLRLHPEINAFIYGHRHIELDLAIGDSCRVMIIGDWIDKFTYAVYDGVTLSMHNYVEGETKA